MAANFLDDVGQPVVEHILPFVAQFLLCPLLILAQNFLVFVVAVVVLTDQGLLLL